MIGMPTIAIDLDGVLASYQGFDPENPPQEIGDPLPGAIDFVKTLLGAGWRVVIHTRNHSQSQLDDWLIAHGLGDANVGAVGAPLSALPIDATVYLDDRALRFDGDFGPILDFLLHGDPRPWWKRQGAAAGGTKA
ncbi:MAG: hypothetical protein QJR08_00555 [Bacillota bacterium]|nr:hypothetical protein [Bacillota bacterium]